MKMLWSILSCDWEVDENQALLELVVDLFLTIRGFSYASAWMLKNSRCHKNFKHFPQVIEILC